MTNLLQHFRFDPVMHLKPYTPISHPFVERLIRTIREEFLYNLLVWNTCDLQKKLDSYQDFFNYHRSHSALNALTPENKSTGNKKVIRINNYKWKKYLNGLIQLSMAA